MGFKCTEYIFLRAGLVAIQFRGFALVSIVTEFGVIAGKGGAPPIGGGLEAPTGRQNVLPDESSPHT